MTISAIPSFRVRFPWSGIFVLFLSALLDITQDVVFHGFYLFFSIYFPGVFRLVAVVP